MHTRELTNLYWFCKAVEYGGYSQASANTKVSAPTISRAVSQLESHVGDKLIHRHSKLFLLTSLGEEYFQRVSPILSQLDQEWALLLNNQTELAGDICVSCPEPFADFFLQDLAVEFMAEHPKVNLHIIFSSDTSKYFAERVDLAIVTTPATIPTLIQKTLFETDLALAASPAYLNARGIPNSIGELSQHDLLAGNTMPIWGFAGDQEQVKMPVSPRYSINSLRLMFKATLDGVGIGLIPKVVLLKYAQKNQLCAVLPDIECPKGKAYLVWSDRILISRRVVAFREKLTERMKETDDFLLTVCQ